MISAAQYLPYYSLTIPQPVGHRYIQTTALFKTKFLSKVTWRKVDKRETKKLKNIFENIIINFNFFPQFCPEGIFEKILHFFALRSFYEKIHHQMMVVHRG